MAAHVFTEQYTDHGRHAAPAGQGTWVFQDAAGGRLVRQGDYAQIVRSLGLGFQWLLAESVRYTDWVDA